MNLTRRSFSTLLGLGGLAGLSACQRPRQREDTPAQDDPVDAPEAEEPEIDLNAFELLAIDMDAWNYDEDADCYYQMGLPYCLKPGSEQYESLSIFVPGAYFVGTPHGATYSCVLSEDGKVAGYTARTAPVALPVNARNYEPQECPTTYSSRGLGRYLEAGMVYVYAGFRGRSGGYESTTQEFFFGGAPWMVADLKAVVRFLRYNAGVLPGDMGRICAFGQGGGGGIVAALGSSGGSSSYDPYLEELGAATHDVEGASLTDDIFGAALWCPIASIGAEDAAYEWMMGQYASSGTRAEGTWTKLLSDDLASAYGEYVNGLGLVDGDGAALTLDRIEDGTFAGGTYYDYLLNTVSDAASAFLSGTEFPYTELPPMTEERFFPGDPSLHAMEAQAEDTSEEAESSDEKDASPATRGVRQIEATVYDTLESYVSSLNGTNRWLTFNSSRGIADVTGLWEFAAVCRTAEEDICAFDRIDRSGYANQLFGTDDEPSLHFDEIAARLIEGQSDRYAQAQDWNEDVVAAYRGDLVEKDALDKTVTERVAMVDPLSYLGELDDSQSVVAPHWRVNTGLFQSQTTLAGELNLALALDACKSVEDVSFEAVWGAGFGLVEREGDAEDNLIEWIASHATGEASAEESETPEEESGSTE